MPAGTSAFGLGTPAVGATRPTGAAGSRFIDPVTRDYQVNATNGQLKQMPGARQRVLLTVLTARTSTGDPLFGPKLPGRMNLTFESDARNAIRASLRQMTDVEHAIDLQGIGVERGRGGRARFTISFVDLATGKHEEVTTDGN